MLSNAALNLGIKDELSDGLSALGHNLENTVEMEHDAALGNGGLGRLAACFLDSMATMDIPATGYGIRYEYGMFKQVIEHGQQMEKPRQLATLWQCVGVPASRSDLSSLSFMGRWYRYRNDHGTRSHWVDAEHVVAMAYDVPVPGYGTETVNNLRLWSAKATREFDLRHFNDGNYEKCG